MGRGEIWVRRKWVFHRRVVHTNTHDFEAKKNQGKNRAMQRHAWASFAPLPLHRRNRLGGIHMPPILARSEGGAPPPKNVRTNILEYVDRLK